jgi:hypothetical protein
MKVRITWFIMALAALGLAHDEPHLPTIWRQKASKYFGRRGNAKERCCTVLFRGRDRRVFSVPGI